MSIEKIARDKNLETFIRDIRPYVEKPVGTLRIDMADVRSVVALYDALLPLLSDKGWKDDHAKAGEIIEQWSEQCRYTANPNLQELIAKALSAARQAGAEAMREAAAGAVSTFIESLLEGLMTDADITDADRRAMRHQITALEMADEAIRALEGIT